MNILIDTNIVIPLEPSLTTDFGINTNAALKFHRLVQKSDSVLFVHPLIGHDISRDKNKERKKLRKKLIKRYNKISSPPPVSILPIKAVKNPKKGTNNYIDNCFLAAVKGDAVDFLVTEDKGIHRKARKLGLQSRVLYLSDAISLLKDFFDETPPPPPFVNKLFVYELEEDDPIFCSLREDYQPTFDSWFKKCKRKHREAYIITDKENTCLAGVCIIKREPCLPTGEQGKTLKLCTFKISDMHHGNRYGELIFKSVFDYADKNNYEYIYFTSFPKQDELIAFAKSFGFISSEVQNNDELIIHKKLSFSKMDIAKYNPLDFHIRFGPRVTSFRENSAFIVPIKPIYHNVLFPELRQQQLLFSDDSQPCGNSIKKAYLCHSPSQLISSGDNLFIYRSQDRQCITALGIIEDTIKSSNPNEIARYVGSRTVYRYSDIVKLCNKPTLAIKFRYVKGLEAPIRLNELIKNTVLKGAPQSVTKLDSKGIKWIKKKLKM